jgi:hypothetical protein
LQVFTDDFYTDFVLLNENYFPHGKMCEKSISINTIFAVGENERRRQITILLFKKRDTNRNTKRKTFFEGTLYQLIVIDPRRGQRI